MNYGQLCPLLDEKGYALHNLASLPHISVAGAAATATHGSGVANGNLATAVKALEMVTAEGELITFSQSSHREEFVAVVVGLGAIGVVTKVTLDIEPTFQVRQDVYEKLPFAQATGTLRRDHGEPATASACSPTGRATASTRCG